MDKNNINVKSLGTKLLAGIGAGFLGYWAYLYLNQSKHVFDPKKEDFPLNQKVEDVQSLQLEMPDGIVLEGWLSRPTTSITATTGVAIYFGGRGEDVVWLKSFAHELAPGCAVVFFNYRGYGTSQGSPSEETICSDSRFIYDWLLGLKWVNPLKIYCIGRSLGTGPAIQLSVDRAIRKLVLITPYDSLEEIAKLRVPLAPLGLLLKSKFNSVKYASLVPCPTLIVLAEEDEVVPHQHTLNLLKNFKSFPLITMVKDSDHLNIPHLEKTRKVIAKFLCSNDF